MNIRMILQEFAKGRLSIDDVEKKISVHSIEFEPVILPNLIRHARLERVFLKWFLGSINHRRRS